MPVSQIYVCCGLSFGALHQLGGALILISQKGSFVREATNHRASVTAASRVEGEPEEEDNRKLIMAQDGTDLPILFHDTCIRPSRRRKMPGTMSVPGSE